MQRSTDPEVRPVISLDPLFHKEIVEHGIREFPNEACGLIAASEGVPVKVFPMTNMDASPVSYRLEPREQLKVFDEIDERGWDLFAIYHSHTHSEAYPSETDRNQAFYPDAYYLVVSLADRDQPILRAFTIAEDEITEEELRVE